MSQWWEQPDKPDTESPSVVVNQPEPMQFWETETDPLPALDMPIPQEPVVEDLPFDEAMSRAATSQPEPVAAAVPAAPEPAGATPEPMPAAPKNYPYSKELALAQKYAEESRLYIGGKESEYQQDFEEQVDALRIDAKEKGLKLNEAAIQEHRDKLTASFDQIRAGTFNEYNLLRQPTPLGVATMSDQELLDQDMNNVVSYPPEVRMKWAEDLNIPLQSWPPDLQRDFLRIVSDEPGQPQYEDTLRAIRGVKEKPPTFMAEVLRRTKELDSSSLEYLRPELEKLYPGMAFEDALQARVFTDVMRNKSTEGNAFIETRGNPAGDALAAIGEKIESSVHAASGVFVTLYRLSLPSLRRASAYALNASIPNQTMLDSATRMERENEEHMKLVRKAYLNAYYQSGGDSAYALSVTGHVVSILDPDPIMNPVFSFILDPTNVADPAAVAFAIKNAAKIVRGVGGLKKISSEGLASLSRSLREELPHASRVLEEEYTRIATGVAIPPENVRAALPDLTSGKFFYDDGNIRLSLTGEKIADSDHLLAQYPNVSELFQAADVPLPTNPHTRTMEDLAAISDEALIAEARAQNPFNIKSPTQPSWYHENNGVWAYVDVKDAFVNIAVGKIHENVELGEGVQNIKVFRSMEELSKLSGGDPASAIPTLREQGVDAVYIPGTAHSPGRLIITKAENAKLTNPVKIDEDMMKILRERIKREAEISTPTINASKGFKVGESVQVGVKDALTGKPTKTSGHIVKVTPDGVHVQFEDGRTVSVKHEQVESDNQKRSVPPPAKEAVPQSTPEDIKPTYATRNSLSQLEMGQLASGKNVENVSLLTQNRLLLASIPLTKDKNAIKRAIKDISDAEKKDGKVWNDARYNEELIKHFTANGIGTDWKNGIKPLREAQLKTPKRKKAAGKAAGPLDPQSMLDEIVNSADETPDLPTPGKPISQAAQSLADNLMAAFHVDANQAAAISTLIDAHAGVWARQMGKKASEWWGKHIQAIEVGKGNGIKGTVTLFQEDGTVSPWYSEVIRQTEARIPNNATPTQIMSTLRSAGVREAELKWMGLDDLLLGRDKISKEELLAWMRHNQVQVDEVVYKQGGFDGELPPITWDSIADEVRNTTMDFATQASWLFVKEFGEAIESAVDFPKFQQLMKTAQGKYDHWLSVNTNPYGEFGLPPRFPEQIEAEKLLDNSILPELKRKFEDGVFNWEDETTLPGGTRYGRNDGPFEDLELPGGNNYHELLLTWKNGTGFMHFHWDKVKDVVAHIRFNTRIDSQGRKVMFLEELQSDQNNAQRASAALIKSYDQLIENMEQGKLPEGWTFSKSPTTVSYDGVPYTNEHWLLRDEEQGVVEWSDKNNILSGKTYSESEAFEKVKDRIIYKRANVQVPADFPWSKNWHELAFKRAARWAVDHDFEAIAWTTGEHQNQRLIAQGGKATKGKNSFYDTIIPTYAERFGKKFGARIEDIEIDVRGGATIRPTGAIDTVKGIPVTDDMRAGVMQGLPLFQDDMRRIELGRGKGQPSYDPEIEQHKRVLNHLNQLMWQDRFSHLPGRKKPETLNIPENAPLTSNQYDEIRDLWMQYYPDAKNAEYVDRTMRRLEDTGNANSAGLAYSYIYNRMMDIIEQKRAANPDVYFQGVEDVVHKGAVTFLEDGKAIIRGFESADISTALHELAHVWRRDLVGDDAKIAWEWSHEKTSRPKTALGTYSRGAEEKFARGFERFLHDAKFAADLPPEIRKVFQSLAEWVKQVYTEITTGSALDVNITPEMRRVYERMFADIPITPAKTRKGKPVVKEAAAATPIEIDAPPTNAELAKMWADYGMGNSMGRSNLAKELGIANIRWGKLSDTEKEALRNYLLKNALPAPTETVPPLASPGAGATPPPPPSNPPAAAAAAATPAEPPVHAGPIQPTDLGYGQKTPGAAGSWLTPDEMSATDRNTANIETNQRQLERLTPPMIDPPDQPPPPSSKPQRLPIWSDINPPEDLEQIAPVQVTYSREPRPTTPEVFTGPTPEEKTRRGWFKNQKGKSFGEQIDYIMSSLERAFTDDAAFANKLSERAIKKYKEMNPGRTVPFMLQTELIRATGKQSSRVAKLASEDLANRMKEVIKRNGMLARKWDEMGDDFQDYYHWKHVLEVSNRFPDRVFAGGLTADEAHRALNALNARLSTEQLNVLNDLSDEYRAANSKVLKRLADSGLISQETFDDLNDSYHWYYRTVNADYLKAAEDSKTQFAGANNAVGIMKYQEKGSDAPILDLFSAFNQHVNEIESAINRNELRKSLIANSLILGQATKLDETELKNGLGVLTYLSEGRRNAYKISDEVASDYERLIKVYDPKGLFRWTSALNSVLKGGAVTYNPLFWLYNWAADIITARGTVALGPVEELQGFIEAVKDKMPFWESEIARLKTEYGGGSGYVGNRSPDQLTSEAERMGREIFGQNQNPKNIWDAVRMPAGDALATVLSWYRAIGSIPEETTRNAVFIQYLKKNNINPRELGIKAMSKEEMELITTHLRTAALLSRRAVNDFDRAGELSRQINMVVPFFNAALQGALIPGRIMRDTFMPGATLGKTGVNRWLTLATFSATATAAGVRNMEQEEYWDIDPEERYRNLILMLPHDRIDQNTGKKVPRYIALPTREWAMFWFPITYGIEQIYHMTHNEKGTAAYSPDVWRAITAAAPGVLPMQDVGDFIPTPLIRGMAEIAANKNFYSGAPIVPPDLKNKKPSEQWDANTPESLVRLSQYFAKDGIEVSPMEMNHWVRSWTAGSGQIFLKTVDSFLDQKERTDMGGIYVLTKQLMELGDDPDARRAFFSDSHISTNDEKLIRQIEEKVLSSKGDTPLLSAVVDRFIRSRGGAKSQLGREKAAELLGVDQLQTREMGRTVAEFAQIQDQERAALDERRKLWVGGDQKNGISPKDYREQLRVLANESNGAFKKSKLDFPQSAMNDPEKWDKWLTAVSTIGGAIPEQRMRADILLQAWRTIELDNDPQTGEPDHDAFNERRRQLVAAMGGKDSADGKLFFNRLFSSMSPTQREKWDDYEKLQPYFLIKNDTFDIDPSFQTLYTELSTVAKDSKVYKDANSSEVGKLYNATLAFERDKFLRLNPDVDEKLVEWGLKAKSVQAQDEEKLNKLREKLKSSAADVRSAEMRATAEPTTARKKAVVTADAQYEALREEIVRQKQIILDPKLALTPVFPPIGNLNQTTVKELIARRNYKLPYGHDPRVNDRVDRAMETMKDTMKALTNGMYTEWSQIPDDFAILDMYEHYARTDKGRKNLAPLPKPTSKLPRPEYYIPSIPQPGVGR